MHSLAFRRASLPRALALAGLGLVLLAGPAPASFAASGSPLPRCSATSAQFYLMRYMEATTANTPPRTVLDLATVPASGAVTLNNIWDGQTAPTPSLRDLSRNAGATVAGAMGKDGYIYAMRAIGTQEPGWDLQGRPWADGPTGRRGGESGAPTPAITKCCATAATAWTTWALSRAWVPTAPLRRTTALR